MDQTLLLWLAGSIFTDFAINIRILQLVNDHKFEYPNRIAVGLNILYLIVSGSISYFIVNLIAVIPAVVISLAFLLIIALVVDRRDFKGINFAQRFIEILHSIDVSITYVLHVAIKGEDIDEAHRALESCFLIILVYISRVITLHPERDQPHISVLRASNGRFKVLCQYGILPERIPQIEEKLKYGEEVVGIAGRAATLQETVCVPDLKDETNGDSAYWVPIQHGEEKKGAIISIPLKRGVGNETPQETVGVITVTSKERNGIHCETVKNLLRNIEPKVEMLLYLLEMVETYQDL